jgi:DNA-binding winged helix-turn-helix (wHTH) protein
LNKAETCSYRFADFTLDVARGRLLRGDTDVALRPKSLAVLTHLLRHAGHVVTKDALMSAVWPDVTVTEDSLTRCIHEVRQALGADAAALLRTVPRRGYMFDAPATDRTAEPEAPLRPDGVAVVPFAVTSPDDLGPDDPGAGTLALGLVQDVINRLSTLRGLHVISLGSAFAAQAAAPDPRSVGRALGVLYVVSGTADLRDTRVRLRVEISEAQGGSIVWTGEYAQDRTGFLELVGGVTAQVAQTLHRQVWAAEARRVRALPPEGLDAWALFHAAMPCLLGNSADAFDLALERFRAAAELSPGFARAWAGQSAVHYARVLSGLTRDAAADMLDARRTALKALQLDPEDPFSHFSLSRSLWLEGDINGARRSAEQSVALSPSFALGHFDLGLIEAFHCDARRGIAELELFRALSPFDQIMASAHAARGIAHFRLDEHAQAVQAMREAVRHAYVFAMVHIPAALVMADCGHGDEARSVVATLRATAPVPGGAALRLSLARICSVLPPLYDRHAAQIGL